MVKKVKKSKHYDYGGWYSENQKQDSCFIDKAGLSKIVVAAWRKRPWGHGFFGCCCFWGVSEFVCKVTRIDDEEKSGSVSSFFLFIAVRIQCEVALQLDNRMRLIMLLSICGVWYIFFILIECWLICLLFVFGYGPYAGEMRKWRLWKEKWGVPRCFWLKSKFLQGEKEGEGTWTALAVLVIHNHCSMVINFNKSETIPLLWVWVTIEWECNKKGNFWWKYCFNPINEVGYCFLRTFHIMPRLMFL